MSEIISGLLFVYNSCIHAMVDSIPHDITFGMHYVVGTQTYHLTMWYAFLKPQKMSILDI